jgi:hypothetical protein
VIASDRPKVKPVRSVLSPVHSSNVSKAVKKEDSSCKAVLSTETGFSSHQSFDGKAPRSYSDLGLRRSKRISAQSRSIQAAGSAVTSQGQTQVSRGSKAAAKRLFIAAQPLFRPYANNVESHPPAVTVGRDQLRGIEGMPKGDCKDGGSVYHFPVDLLVDALVRQIAEGSR